MTSTHSFFPQLVLGDHDEQSPPNFILDIDEDFFSTEDSIRFLANAGWDNVSLALVDQVLDNFCAHSEVEEAIVAQALVRAVVYGPQFAIDYLQRHGVNPMCYEGEDELLGGKLTEFVDVVSLFVCFFLCVFFF